jgi:hypothetical protein
MKSAIVSGSIEAIRPAAKTSWESSGWQGRQVMTAVAVVGSLLAHLL